MTIKIIPMISKMFPASLHPCIPANPVTCIFSLIHNAECMNTSHSNTEYDARIVSFILTSQHWLAHAHVRTYTHTVSFVLTLQHWLAHAHAHVHTYTHKVAFVLTLQHRLVYISNTCGACIASSIPSLLATKESFVHINVCGAKNHLFRHIPCCKTPKALL